MEELLSQYFTAAEMDPTHVTYHEATQEWKIQDDKYEMFWTGYCKLTSEGQQFCCLAEHPTANMPIIDDLTLKFNLPVVVEGMSKFHLLLVYCYQQVITEILAINNVKRVTCCILSRKPYVLDGNMKYQFRLQFPFCKTSTKIQYNIIRPRVISMLRRDNVFACLSHQPINDFESIISQKTLLCPIIMFGSTKHPNRTPLQLDYVIAKIKLEQIELGVLDILELENVFHGPKFWLPMFLSLHYFSGLMPPNNLMNNI